MSYKEWFNSHAKKHKIIVNRLKNQSCEEIIEYFVWENLSKTDVDFCPLFKENRKCHDIKDLNCYLCACPNFCFDDNAKEIKSYCSIDSKKGKKFYHKGTVHQDCSGCFVPHNKKYIKEHFNRCWKMIFGNCCS